MLEPDPSLRPELLAADCLHSIQEALNRPIADDVKQELIVILQ